MTGRHQWIIVVSYGLTDAEAASTALHAHQQRLDAEHRMAIDGPVCLNCEEPWAPDVARARCARPWYDAQARPVRVVQL